MTWYVIGIAGRAALLVAVFHNAALPLRQQFSGSIFDSESDEQRNQKHRSQPVTGIANRKDLGAARPDSEKAIFQASQGTFQEMILHPPLLLHASPAVTVPFLRSYRLFL